jgi:prophage antirepressor-like protein
MNPSIFNFKEHSVRVVFGANNEPWFCLTDVYKSLDISRTSRLFRELDEKGVADCRVCQ